MSWRSNLGSTLNKVLYILSKGPNQLLQELLQENVPPDMDISVILIQDSVSMSRIPLSHVFVLSEDAVSRHVTPSFPTVSYCDMLCMIFEADRVVAL